MEHFQWLTQAQSHVTDPEKLEQIRQEIGDILIYLVRLADKLDIDPLKAARDKIRIKGSKCGAVTPRREAGKVKEFVLYDCEASDTKRGTVAS